MARRDFDVLRIWGGSLPGQMTFGGSVLMQHRTCRLGFLGGVVGGSGEIFRFPLNLSFGTP